MFFVTRWNFAGNDATALCVAELFAAAIVECCPTAHAFLYVSSSKNRIWCPGVLVIFVQCFLVPADARFDLETLAITENFVTISRVSNNLTIRCYVFVVRRQCRNCSHWQTANVIRSVVVCVEYVLNAVRLIALNACIFSSICVLKLFRMEVKRKVRSEDGRRSSWFKFSKCNTQTTTDWLLLQSD